MLEKFIHFFNKKVKRKKVKRTSIVTLQSDEDIDIRYAKMIFFCYTISLILNTNFLI